MKELIAFLRAQLDKDEQTARAVAEQQPITEWDAVGAGEDDDVSKSWWGVTGIARADPTPRSAARAVALHIARWDPARVLAEVAFKRELLHWCERSLFDDDGEPWLDDGWNASIVAARQVLESMAFLYADHPDYDPGWALADVTGE